MCAWYKYLDTKNIQIIMDAKSIEIFEKPGQIAKEIDV